MSDIVYILVQTYAFFVLFELVCENLVVQAQKSLEMIY